MRFSKRKLQCIGLIFFVVTLPFILNIIIINDYGMLNVDPTLHTSAEQAVKNYDAEWLINNGFSGTSPWYNSEEDNSNDVSASIGGGTANFMVNGDERTFSDISGKPLISDWTAVNNTKIKLDPKYYTIDSEGCFASHNWSDPSDPGQLVSIHWDRNITLGVDMSDYNITSVSLVTTVNASVETDSGNCDGPGNTNSYEHPGIETITEGTQQSTGDFVRFYVLISDIYKNQQHEVAYYQSVDLGLESGPIPYLYDLNLTNLNDETIIYHISSVLEEDPEHKTFTISLGMRILCEDNYNWDYDVFNELRIKNCDFSFTYEKIINKITTTSWNQVGPTFTSVKHNATNNITLIDATLRFDYTITQLWPTSISPNAQIIIFINNNQNPITLNLERVETGWNREEYNIKSLISVSADYVNFTIQLYIPDEFGLDQVITISIDNVYLHIWYQEIGDIPPPKQPYDFTPWIIAFGIAIGAMTIGILAYAFYFKYPAMVRKIRSLRRKIKRGKTISKPVPVKSRQQLASGRTKAQMNVLRMEEGAVSKSIIKK